MPREAAKRRSGIGVPNPYVRIVTSGGEPIAVRGVDEGADLLGVPAQFPHEGSTLAGGCCLCGESYLAGRHGQRDILVYVAPNHLLHVPHPHEAIVIAAQEPAAIGR